MGAVTVELSQAVASVGNTGNPTRLNNKSEET